MVNLIQDIKKMYQKAIYILYIYIYYKNRLALTTFQMKRFLYDILLILTLMNLLLKIFDANNIQEEDDKNAMDDNLEKFEGIQQFNYFNQEIKLKL